MASPLRFLTCAAVFLAALAPRAGGARADDAMEPLLPDEGGASRSCDAPRRVHHRRPRAELRRPHGGRADRGAQVDARGGGRRARAEAPRRRVRPAVDRAVHHPVRDQRFYEQLPRPRRLRLERDGDALAAHHRALADLRGVQGPRPRRRRRDDPPRDDPPGRGLPRRPGVLPAAPGRARLGGRQGLGRAARGAAPPGQLVPHQRRRQPRRRPPCPARRRERPAAPHPGPDPRGARPVRARRRHRDVTRRGHRRRAALARGKVAAVSSSTSRRPRRPPRASASSSPRSTSASSSPSARSASRGPSWLPR